MPNPCKKHCGEWRPDYQALMKSKFRGLVKETTKNAIRAALVTATPDRLRMVAQALREGTSPADVHQYSKYDPWFIEQFQHIIASENRIREHGLPKDANNLRMLKAQGFSDTRLGELSGEGKASVSTLRHKLNVHPVYKRIDTCAAEFASPTAYMYSTYEVPFAGEVRDEAQPSTREKIIILGGGTEPYWPGH